MADIALTWNNDIGAGDLCVVGADLLADDGLETAVLLSLFSDRRAREEEIPPGQTWRRGWWGDLLADDQDQIGSKLWLLEREKQSPTVLVRAATLWFAIVIGLAVLPLVFRELREAQRRRSDGGLAMDG